MTAYFSPVHALRDLLTPSSSPRDSIDIGSCRITNIPQNIHHMTNGIEYCAVEVTCDDGTQYGIQAYGQEAMELHKEAFRLSEKQIEEKKKVSVLCMAI